MKANINHHLFNEFPLDSGAITMACSVVNNLPEPGNYACSVIAKDRAVSRFHIEVDEKHEAKQLAIDLAATRAVNAEACSCKSEAAAGQHLELNPAGWVVFYVSRGEGGYAVRVDGKLKANEKPAVIDTRRLTAPGMFAVALLRPGTHTMTNSTGAKGKITVAYPGSKKGERFSKAKPVEVRCTDKEFVPKEVTLEAAQGIFYRIESKSPSRIRIELSKPEDGPDKDRPSSVYRWRRPPAPKSAKPQAAAARPAKKVAKKAK